MSQQGFATLSGRFKTNLISSSGATTTICGQKLYYPRSCVAWRGNIINMTRICGQKAKFLSCLARWSLYRAAISCRQDERQASINCHTHT